MVFTMLPTFTMPAFAADTGAFTVSGDNAATYDSAAKVLTVTGDCTISMAAGATNTDKIVVKNGTTANITLSSVNIDVSATSGACAFDMTGATVNLTLSGANTLKSGENKAGLQVTAGAMLTIGGTGTLNATGGNQGAGIGDGDTGAGGTITISGGTVTAKSGYMCTNCIGSGNRGEGGTTIITGGSVNVGYGQIDPAPTNGTTDVYLAKLPATGFTSGNDIKVKVDGVDFKIPAKHVGDDNSFYLYLPATVTEATVGTSKYTCTVEENNINVFVEKAASYGVMTEPELNQAIEAAIGGTPTTIKLGATFSVGKTVTITDKNIILDLNGQTLSSGPTVIKLNSTSSLEVKDSRVGATGVLSATNTGNVTIDATGSGTESPGKTAIVSYGDLVTISGGTLGVVAASMLNLSGDPTLTVVLNRPLTVSQRSCEKVNITGAHYH